MQTVFKSAQRGGADHGWLKAKHSFSFADWHDPNRIGFGVLRVINEDLIAAKTGFGTHGHRDMEIVTYVLDGAISHKDSMGNGESGSANAGIVKPGEVQRMSAGSGVMHSEFNNEAQTTHILQIWMLPRTRGGAPGYEQTHIPPDSVDGQLSLIAAPEGGLVYINSDARLLIGKFHGAQTASMALSAGRSAYVHLARGALTVNGERLKAGDALQVSGAEQGVVALELKDGEAAEVLVFDVGQPP
jgi:quercetin 2,3-dioxygenase